MKFQSESKETVIDVFVAFLLLSYTKLILIFYSSVKPTYILSANSSLLVDVRLAEDTSVKYFSPEHILFAFVSTTVLLLLVLPSVLILALYPTKCCNTVLSKLKLNGRWTLALNIFVQKFHCCYRVSKVDMT